MKRTKMMVTTLAMALMAMGSTTAAFAADGENAQLHPFAKGDIIAVNIQEMSLEDMQKIEDRDMQKLTKEMLDSEEACTVTVAYCTEDGVTVLPEGSDLDITKLDETEASQVVVAAEAVDFHLEELKEMDWLPVDGDLEISEQVMKDADGKEILMKIVKLTDAVQTK